MPDAFNSREIDDIHEMNYHDFSCADIIKFYIL